MSINTRISLGIVGANVRGESFKAVLDAIGAVRVHAVCDLDPGRAADAAGKLGPAEHYTDYEQMLDRARPDAVLIATPMPLHVTHAVSALQRGVHVLSEVPAGVSIDECRQLVQACRASHAIYVMAENYLYTRPNVLIRELVRRGLFGTPYYAEGEYLHELKGLNRETPWRRQWQTGINGITYGTHSLGPILQWMPGDRVVAVSCTGAGHHHHDLDRRPFEAESTCVMLCRMRSGGLVKIRVDMISDRPEAPTNYLLQGTDGAYESARAPGERNRIWLQSRSDHLNHWLDLEQLENDFLPAAWRDPPGVVTSAGHGGSDYYQIAEFVDVIEGRKDPDVGIHAAMDMTLPGLISQQSIREDGRWLEVPDSRTW